MTTHTLSVLVENKPGVLAHVAGLFSRRAFNIGSLAVGPTADAGVSRGFYEELGLTVGRPTLNQGPTQIALDGLAEVCVDVVPMLPQTGTPHLELLRYRSPAGRAAARLQANDVAATRIVWRSNRDGLLRDPDGHLHLLSELSA